MILNERLLTLKSLWESASFELEKFQTNHICVEQEKLLSQDEDEPFCIIKDEIFESLELYDNLNKLGIYSHHIPGMKPKPSIAVIREEGSNGDREMRAAFYHAGFDVYDVTMNDLLNEKVSLSMVNYA